MDSLFPEAVQQIIEFLDYLSILKFTSTCHAFRKFLHSRQIIDKYRLRMINVHKVHHVTISSLFGTYSKQAEYYDVGNNTQVYCSKCSTRLYDSSMHRHTTMCNKRKYINICNFNKPHVGVCDCPYSTFECRFCCKNIYSYKYVDHFSDHIFSLIKCHCGNAIRNIDIGNHGEITMYCDNCHTIQDTNISQREYDKKWLWKKYKRVMHTCTILNPNVERLP
jgi:hypothetical protein